MLFNSLQFLLFFIVVYALYLRLPHRAQNHMLLVASYVFYASWDWRFLSLIVLSTGVDYACGLAIARAGPARRRKQLLAVSVATNLGILGIFKYFNFFAANAQHLLSLAGWQADQRLLNVVLPVGISFYTFQTMSYTINVYRGTLQPTRRFLDFALFVAFFPQLVAGPIERASHLLPQILRPRHVDAERISQGAFLVLLGLFQKVVLADNLALVVDPVFNGPLPSNALHVLLAVYGFAFQILCDFAGYSCIARGLAACMGFDIMINFHAPYFARSPSEFWRRWHISLSTWLRDYLYIPLGGNRHGRLRTLRNLALTMLLGGLWHGAAWTFVAWGAYHGVLLALYRMLPTRPRPATTNVLRTGLRAFAGWFLCFHLVCLGWLLFRSATLAQAGHMLRILLGGAPYVADAVTVAMLWRFLPAIALLVFLQALQFIKDDVLAPWRLPVIARTALILVCFYAIILFGVDHAQSFIYFRF